MPCFMLDSGRGRYAFVLLGLLDDFDFAAAVIVDACRPDTQSRKSRGGKDEYQFQVQALRKSTCKFPHWAVRRESKQRGTSFFFSIVFRIHYIAYKRGQ